MGALVNVPYLYWYGKQIDLEVGSFVSPTVRYLYCAIGNQRTSMHVAMTGEEKEKEANENSGCIVAIVLLSR